MWLGDVVDLSKGLRVWVGVDADGGGGSSSVVLQDGVLHRRDGRGRCCRRLLDVDGLERRRSWR